MGDLSLPKSNRSPQRYRAPCAQVKVFERGDSPTDDSDSDANEDYNTPPESPEVDDTQETENDDPNMPEYTDDETSEDEDNEILLNMAENDSAIETGNLRNFPDLLRIHNSGHETNSDEETVSLSKVTGARPKEPLHIGSWPRRNNPPLREVVLPQLPQSPCPKGVCVPPYNEPPEPWYGFGSENELTNFLSERIPMCDEQSVTNTTKKEDPMEDMEKYIETIMDSDDEDEKECKKDYNNALAMYTKVQLIHDDKKENEDSKNEENFKDIWNLSKEEADSSVKDLCESLGKLNIDEEQENDNSDSSTNTVIETKKAKLSQEEEKKKKKS